MDVVETPIGPLRLVCDGGGRLLAVDWDAAEARLSRILSRAGGAPSELRRVRDPFGVSSAFARYFDGAVTALDALAVGAPGTPFQLRVWAALREIPAGTTTSYGALAKAIGKPRAVRAVGMANHWNPTGIVVPCHRVVGADGTLTGYAGGLERKAWLLDHEAKHAERAPRGRSAQLLLGVSSGAVRS